jgi:hypothetical protein
MRRRWHRTSRQIYISMERGTIIITLCIGFFIHKRIISAVKRVEFFSYWVSYIILYRDGGTCWE